MFENVRLLGESTTLTKSRTANAQMNPPLFANQCSDMTLYHRTFVQEGCRYNNSKTFVRHAVTLDFETRNVLAKRKKVIREHRTTSL
jgi:hypothetical protein